MYMPCVRGNVDGVGSWDISIRCAGFGGPMTRFCRSVVVWSYVGGGHGMVYHCKLWDGVYCDEHKDFVVCCVGT